LHQVGLTNLFILKMHGHTNIKYAKHVLELSHSFGPIHETMQILQYQGKEAHLNTIERYFIYKEFSKNNHLNDEFNISPNKIFDALLKPTNHKNPIPPSPNQYPTSRVTNTTPPQPRITATFSSKPGTDTNSSNIHLWRHLKKTERVKCHHVNMVQILQYTYRVGMTNKQETRWIVWQTSHSEQ